MRRKNTMRSLRLALIAALISAAILAGCDAGPPEGKGNNATIVPTAATMATDQTVSCFDMQGAAAVPDLGGKSIKIAVENAYPPFNSCEGSNCTGWDYDAGAEICKRANCKPVFTEAAWDGIFPAMASGEYDTLFDGVTYTTERDQTIDFSCAYANVEQVLLVRADESRFTNPDGFKADASLKAATQNGTTNAIVAKDFVGDARTQLFDDFGLAVQALLSKDADAVVIDRISAKGYMDENPGKMKVIEPPVSANQQLALGFPPNSPLLDPFNKALASMAADGTLKQLNDKWLSGK
jgi:polar amino acid transport system substrate-binding protein